MDLADPTFPVSSASTMAAPAPAGPCSGGSKSVLDGMAGPSMKPVELQELAGSSMKPVHLEEMAGPSMNPVELEELDPMGDVDKQRLKWETINEDQQVWDALDEQRKLRKKEEMKQRQEERKHKQEERRHKQEERRLKQEYNKKIKLEVAARRKELQDRKKKQANELQDTKKKSKMVRAEGGGSPCGVTRSPGVNMLRSRLGVLANVAASKRGRSLSDMDGSPPSQKNAKPTNELETYLKEDIFPRRDDFNILEWWALHSSKYPVLSRIARDILAVPASVVPSESAFSTGQRVVSDYRSRLKSTTVEALICLQDWLKHVQSLAHVVDDDDL